MTSLIISDTIQIDGRRHIIERHVDDFGITHDYFYMAESNTDVNAIMTARVATLEAQLVEADIQLNIQRILEGNYGEVINKYATLTDIRAALRNFYQTATREEVGRMAGFLLTLTDAQLRTLFNMTQSQVNQLKTRLQARFDELTAVLTATGE